MDKKRFWFMLFVALLTIWSALYLLPTVLPDGSLPGWYPFDRKLNFGLDLKGGLELKYTVDYKKAILENSRDLMFRLQEFVARETLKVPLDEKVSREQVEAIKKRATFSVPVFNTVVVETDDQEIRDLLSGDTIKERVDVRYRRFEEGNRIVLQMSTLDIDRIKTEVVDQTLQIIRKRIDAFGLVEPDVRTSGDSDIDVQLPGVSKEQMDVVRERIGQTARLTFRIVDNKSDFFADAREDLAAFKASNPEKGKTIEITRFSDRYQAKSEKKSHLVGFIHYLQTIKKIPDDHVVGFYYVEEQQAGRVAKSYYRTEYLFADVRVSGEHVARSRVFYQSSGQPYVSLAFTSRGGIAFGDLTREHVGDYLAIMLDDDVNSAPVIKEEIAGGSAQITLGGNRSMQETLREAQSLVTVLTHGAYKAPVHKVQDNEVGPSLGKDSIEAGFLSFIISMAFVFLFMIGYYRFSGLLASLAVVLNILFIFAVLVAFNSALSMPGLAGIVLTVAMSVDANVIIYERIREELRAGKSARQSVDLGFERAFWTIFDSQLTTALAGVILMNFTTGPVYGFAVTLIIGIVTSVFTALYIVKSMFYWLLDHKFIKETVSI
jgi:preprotein translocase subunit SecD